MKRLLLVSVFGFYLWSCVLGNPVAESLPSVTVKNCGRSMYDADTRDRIVGGGHARHGEYPFMVSLHENKVHVCGGSIINENWILTAAHCIEKEYLDQPYNYDVRAGLHKLSEPDGRTVQIREVEKIIIHERYIGGNFDVALLKLLNPLNIAGSKGFVNGVCLPDTMDDPTGIAIVCGWGHEWFQGKDSDTLKHVALPLVDRETCNRDYVRNGFSIVQKLEICAGGEKGKDSCQNDSGGPLIRIDNDGRAILIGVVSSGPGCGNGGLPGLYTNAAYFTPWIKSTIAKN